MSVNLIELFQSSIGKSLISNASSLLGEKEGAMGAALGAALPSILGGVINKGSSEKGAGQLIDMIQKGGFNGGMLDNIGDLFSDSSKSSSFMNQGGGLLSSLLGDKLGGIVDIISSVGGIKSGSSSSLLKMVAPMLISMIGKRIMKDGLGAKGLMSLLGGQRDFVKAAAPAGLSSVLGFDNWASSAIKKVSSTAKDVVGSTVSTASNVGKATVSTAANVGKATVNTAKAAANTTKSGISKILPWLLIGLVGILAVFFIRSCNSGESLGDAAKSAASQTTGLVKKGADATGDVIKKGADATGDAIKKGADATGDAIVKGADAVKKAFKSISLPGGLAIDAPEGGFSWNMSNFMSGKGSGDGKFIFDDVHFQTGSDKITDTSMRQLNNLSSILKAYPKATIRIEGHTDNTGVAQNNLDLSRKRAIMVKKVITDSGISENRIATKGIGQNAPIASNDTEEGRAQNRRVEVYVTSK